MYITEAERLSCIYPFDDDVLCQVGEIADFQRARDFADLQIPKPTNAKTLDDRGYPVDFKVLDINSDQADSMLVYHLPMGNGLDANMRMRVATLASVLPETRVLASGNPTSPFNSQGKLSRYGARKVWSGDLSPTVDNLLNYICRTSTGNVTHVGYSYGAERAAEAAYASAVGKKRLVEKGVFIEPVSVVKRGLIRLGMDFGKTAKELENYIKAADCRSYDEARALADREGHGLVGYGLGLARLSNLAIAHALASDYFETRVDEAMAENPDMQTTIMWGSGSELAVPEKLKEIQERLRVRYQSRVNTIEIPGQKHAMGDDLYLHTAMVLQALKTQNLLLLKLPVK